MKIDIVVVYVQRHERGHGNQPVNFEGREEYSEINERVREKMHPSQSNSRVTVSLHETDVSLRQTSRGHSSVST